MKFKSPELPANPTPEQWRWWRKCFTDGLAINDITDDGHQLIHLRTQAGSDLFSLLEEATTLNEGLTILDRQFKKPTRVLYERHQLLTCRQKHGECVTDFVKRLKVAVQKCECKEMTAKQHQDARLRDALVSGVESDMIRVRLLELKDAEATLEHCISVACAEEVSNEFSRQFKTDNNEATPSLAYAEVEEENSEVLNAVRNSNKPAQKYKQSTASGRRGSSCQFCGLNGNHLHRNCPARNDSCHKCGKAGHWAAACKSTTGPNDNRSDKDKGVNAVLCSLSSETAFFDEVFVRSKHKVKSLIDTGATGSFVCSSVIEQLNLPMSSQVSNTMMANRTSLECVGFSTVPVEIQGHKYTVTFKVVDRLVADMIIGTDVLGEHTTIEFKPGGHRQPISFTKPSGSQSVVSMLSAMFPALQVEPPTLFSERTLKVAEPVRTKSRFSSRSDRDFMDKEVERLLESGINEVSHSPWRAQAFVVKGNNRKPRMVIDYSETINKYTEVDAYPFPNPDSIIDEAAEWKVFSKIDLKSAYHQIEIRESDKPLTSFEVNGKLYQFCRLPFGITNAVPVFQKCMDSIISEHKL